MKAQRVTIHFFFWFGYFTPLQTALLADCKVRNQGNAPCDERGVNRYKVENILDSGNRWFYEGP